MIHLKTYESIQKSDNIIGPTFHRETDIKIRKMYPDTWDELQQYRMVDVDKLFKVYSFVRRFDEAINNSLLDIFGKNCISSGEIRVDQSKRKELCLLIINGLNWYSFLKKLYKKQIVFPQLRVIDSASVDTICYHRDFQEAMDTFFKYIWGFRSALLIKNDMKNRDVMYIQKNIYSKIYNDGYIIRHPILKNKSWEEYNI